MDTKNFRIFVEEKRVEDIILNENLNNKIHLYFGLRGGMEQEKKQTKIVFHNCNGFPSDKNNKHKLK